MGLKFVDETVAIIYQGVKAGGELSIKTKYENKTRVLLSSRQKQ